MTGHSCLGGRGWFFVGVEEVCVFAVQRRVKDANSQIMQASGGGGGVVDKRERRPKEMRWASMRKMEDALKAEVGMGTHGRGNVLVPGRSEDVPHRTSPCNVGTAGTGNSTAARR